MKQQKQINKFKRKAWELAWKTPYDYRMTHQGNDGVSIEVWLEAYTQRDGKEAEKLRIHYIKKGRGDKVAITTVPFSFLDDKEVPQMVETKRLLKELLG